MGITALDSLQWHDVVIDLTCCLQAHLQESDVVIPVSDSVILEPDAVISHKHTHPVNSPFSWTTRLSQYQEGKTNLDFTEARDSEWQWHQLGHMQVCTSLQTDNHASTPPLFFTGRMPFLPPNQQHQRTEGISNEGMQ